MSIFCEYQKIQLHAHGLTKLDEGSVFVYKNNKLVPIPSEEIFSRRYGDWTFIVTVVDDNNFICYSGEEDIFKINNKGAQEMSDLSRYEILQLLQNVGNILNISLKHHPSCYPPDSFYEIRKWAILLAFEEGSLTRSEVRAALGEKLE